MGKNKKPIKEARNTEMFDCPICGNECYRSDRNHIKCPWCNNWIIPKGKKTKQEAGIDKR